MDAARGPRPAARARSRKAAPTRLWNQTSAKGGLPARSRASVPGRVPRVGSDTRAFIAPVRHLRFEPEVAVIEGQDSSRDQHGNRPERFRCAPELRVPGLAFRRRTTHLPRGDQIRLPKIPMRELHLQRAESVGPDHDGGGHTRLFGEQPLRTRGDRSTTLLLDRPTAPVVGEPTGARRPPHHGDRPALDPTVSVPSGVGNLQSRSGRTWFPWRLKFLPRSRRSTPARGRACLPPPKESTR
jgi:hypothetical protein